jgi:acyl-CoA thioester hydrolase
MTPAHAFRHVLHVTPADIDDMDHVNNVVYVRWAQEVAAAHWNQIASPSLRGAYSWVVLSHEVDYRHPAFLGTQVTGFTWVGDHHGARFDRYVRLVSGDEATVFADVKTTWCLIDSVRARPTRITEEILSLL